MKAQLRSTAQAVVGIFVVSACVCFPGGAVAQGGARSGWAARNDPLASKLIEAERTWATLSCLPRNRIAAASAAFAAEYIADDFVGTSPRGPLYTKSDMFPKHAPPTVETERDCKLLSARVRYFGPDVAVIYGRESAILKGPGGKVAPRTLVWTDTWLRRAGKWQIIAVQDMVPPKQ
ncbi:MAG TPA: nuclear transport factor 2 family protein [Sphingomonas sp.]|nr:nuclear transport factor 2 family protein [Sphingomonas sp.]